MNNKIGEGHSLSFCDFQGEEYFINSGKSLEAHYLPVIYNMELSFSTNFPIQLPIYFMPSDNLKNVYCWPKLVGKNLKTFDKIMANLYAYVSLLTPKMPQFFNDSPFAQTNGKPGPIFTKLGIL